MVNKPIVPGSAYSVPIQVTGDSSYPSGGYSLSASDIATLFGTGRMIESFDVLGVSPNANGVADAFYNYTTSKLQLLQSNGTEVTGTTNVAATTVNLRVWYKNQ